MSKREPDNLLQDILQSAENILTYTRGITYDDFVSNQMMIDAVIRNFEIIGEAANRLPNEYKDQCPQIDWFKIRGLRNRIVHNYFGIDYDIIWLTKENYLPELISDVQDLLKKL
ncbi:MAG: DUF86 domain-containing protein [Bacteroidota bacterium]